MTQTPKRVEHSWHPFYLDGSVRYWWCSCGCGGVTKDWMGDPQYEHWQRDWTQDERDRRRGGVQ